MKTLIKFFSVLLLTLFINASVYAQEGDVPEFPDDQQLESWDQTTDHQFPMLLNDRKISLRTVHYHKYSDDETQSFLLKEIYHPATGGKWFGLYVVRNLVSEKLDVYIYKYNTDEGSRKIALKINRGTDMNGVYWNFMKSEFGLTSPYLKNT